MGHRGRHGEEDPLALNQDNFDGKGAGAKASASCFEG